MSVRICDSQSELVLLLDRATQARWSASTRKQAANVFSRVVEIDVSAAPGAVASRHLKTSMRSLVDGDFLFLDSDTLMMAMPAAMFAGQHDVGAALDRNWQQWRPHRPSWVEPYYQRLGWNFSTHGYFNTGVLFLRDSDACRRLGDEWHERWSTFLSNFAKHQDQPAFNSLLNAPELQLKTFPLRYNAMVDAIPFFCWRAHIVHYFLFGGRRLNPNDSLLWVLANRWQEQGVFDQALFETHRARRDPWVHPTRSIQIELACGRIGTAAGLAWSRATGK